MTQTHSIAGDWSMKRDDSQANAPQIDELLERFVNRQAEGRAAGWPELPVGEVEPYEAAFAPMVEPRVAFDEAIAALQLLDIAPDRSSITPPPDWSTMVTGAGSFAALAFAAGNFPQLVPDLPALVPSQRPPRLPPTTTAPAPPPALPPCGNQTGAPRRRPHS